MVTMYAGLVAFQVNYSLVALFVWAIRIWMLQLQSDESTFCERHHTTFFQTNVAFCYRLNPIYPATSVPSTIISLCGYVVLLDCTISAIVCPNTMNAMQTLTSSHQCGVIGCLQSRNCRRALNLIDWGNMQ